MSNKISVSSIAKYCNPFSKQDNPWGTKPITMALIKSAIKNKRFVNIKNTDDHVGRIAWLVTNPTNEPIEIDVGIPALGCGPDWMVIDGNHRLAAAIFSKQKIIMANISGQVDHAEKLFGISLDDTEEIII